MVIETTLTNQKKKLTESKQISDLSIEEYFGDFETNGDSIDYSGMINVFGKALTKEGQVADIGFYADIDASATYGWESDETPTGLNHSRDEPTFSSSTFVSTGLPEVNSVSFTPEEDFFIAGDAYSLRDAQQLIDPTILRQLLNPALYVKLINPAFEKYAENMDPPEQDYDEPDRDY